MSAARAIANAVADQDPSAHCLAVDALRDHCRFPLTRFPDLYGPLVGRAPWLWLTLWSLCDREGMADRLTALAWPLAASGLRRLVESFRPSVLVALHPLLARPVVRLSREYPGLKTAVVVTDLVQPHRFWLAPGGNLCFLPTDEAADRASARGLKPEHLVVLGQPVASRPAVEITRGRAKARLSLMSDLPLVLVAAGGAGIGPIWEVSTALDQAGLPLQLAIICGRNQSLRARLTRRSWSVPARILGYTEEMPLWLRAADLLVTKAGPSALAEALAEGLAIVIMGALPGQETDNVRYLTSRGAAVWAPGPGAVRETVGRLLPPSEEAAMFSSRAIALARPEAASAIAERLLALAQPERISVASTTSN